MTAYKPIPDAIDRIAAGVVDAAYKVHATLRPGLLINFNVPVIRDGIKRLVL